MAEQSNFIPQNYMPERDEDFLPIAVFREFEKRIEAHLKHISDVMVIIHDNSKDASTKAEQANSKRFDTFNEFNQRMRELAETFLPRETFETLDVRVRNLENTYQLKAGRSSLSDPLLMLMVAGCGGLVTFLIQLIFKR